MSEKTELKETIKIPEHVTATYAQGVMTIKGPHGELTRTMNHPKLEIQLHDGCIEIICRGTIHRKEKALVGTYRAHVRNMIKGVTEGYTYTMKTVYSHFPIKTSVDKNRVVIQNFLGERAPRYAEICDNVKVEVKGDIVIVSGIDREKVGQTAANIERATKVKNRDVRVFQDGIYLTSTRG
ncbi:MAG: 50S ribosomal protein L6 [Candidatus Thermoplasmatota archaeon]